MTKYDLRLQESILEKYGEEVISRKRFELCGNCTRPDGYGYCSLCPITSTGKDCPYFTRKES